MALSVQKDKIMIKAFDNGPGIQDLKKAMTQGYSTAPDWVRELGFGAGMGLPNIKNNSDKLVIHTKKDKFTKLSIEVDLPILNVRMTSILTYKLVGLYNFQ